MEFRTDPIFEALRSPLGLVDDPERRQILERYVEAARLPLERAVFDVLAALTQSVEEQVGAHYRVRLSYRTGALELDVEQKEAPEPYTLAEAEWASTDGETEKVTIRIPAELKELVAEAASGAGLSVNSWFIRVLVGALRGAVYGTAGAGRAQPRQERHELRDQLREARERERELREREREERRGRGQRLSGWIGGE